MDNTVELIPLFYTLSLLNNNELRNDLRVILLLISHFEKQVNLNKEMISDASSSDRNPI